MVNKAGSDHLLSCPAFRRAPAWPLLVLCAWPIAALDAAGCGDAVSDAEINECFNADLARADEAVDRAYRRVLAELEAPATSEARDAVVRAHRHWHAFREADCDAVFAFNQGGTVRLPAYAMCMTAHAQQRQEQLEAYLR